MSRVFEIWKCTESYASSASKSDNILKDIIEDDLGDKNEITQAVIQSTLDTIDDVCNNMQNKISNSEEDDAHEGIG